MKRIPEATNKKCFHCSNVKFESVIHLPLTIVTGGGLPLALLVLFTLSKKQSVDTYIDPSDTCAYDKHGNVRHE